MTTTGQTTAIDIDAIRERSSRYLGIADRLDANGNLEGLSSSATASAIGLAASFTAADVPALLARIDELSAELDRQQQAHAETVDKVMADGWTRVADEFDAAAKAGA